MQRRTLLKAFALSASVMAIGLSFQAYAADTIKVGIMHSLSGTMAISETPLKDVALMAIDDINAKGGCWARNWSRWWSTRPPTGRCLPRRRASCWPGIKWRWCLAAGRRSRVNRSCRCLRN